VKRALLIFALAVACGGSAEHPTANAGPAQRTAMAGQMISFDGSASTGTITKYTWDFGDMTASVDAESTSHAFASDGSYTVTLTVHGPGGSSAATVLVNVGASCSAVAKIVVQTQNPMPGDVVLFGSTGSTGCMGASITQYDWDFGDGNMVSGDASKASVTHTYTTAGTYGVKLHVADANMPPAEGQSTYQLGVGVVNNGKPMVLCQVSAMGQTNKPVSLTASGSDPGGKMMTYAWSFSDGATAMGSAVMHAFTMAGSYTATVVATTSDSRMSDPCMTSITISDPINYSGNWLISPTGNGFQGDCPFSVSFPTASLAIFQSANPDGGNDILTVSPMMGTYPAGYPLTGTEGAPGVFVVNSKTSDETPGGSCGDPMQITHTIHLTFSSATAVTGTWSKFYNGCVLQCPTSCDCTAGTSASSPMDGTFSGFPQ
jgi:PKD repeat protein